MDKTQHLSFPEVKTRGGRTRLRLVRAALAVLKKLGGEGLTFEAVGNEAAMNRSQVRYHFPTLDSLMKEAVRWVTHLSQQYTVEHLAKGTTARHRLERFVEAAIFAARDIPEQVPVMLYLFSRAAYDPSFRDIYAIGAKAGAERLAALLGEVLKPFAVDAKHLHLTAEELRGCLVGIALDMVLRGDEKHADHYARAAKRLVLGRAATLAGATV